VIDSHLTPSPAIADDSILTSSAVLLASATVRTDHLFIIIGLTVQNNSTSSSSASSNVLVSGDLGSKVCHSSMADHVETDSVSDQLTEQWSTLQEEFAKLEVSDRCDLQLNGFMLTINLETVRFLMLSSGTKQEAQGGSGRSGQGKVGVCKRAQTCRIQAQTVQDQAQHVIASHSDCLQILRIAVRRFNSNETCSRSLHASD
jgi:TolA-binding protein